MLDCVLQVVDLHARGMPTLQPTPLEARARQREVDGDLRQVEPRNPQRVAPERRAELDRGQEVENAKFLGEAYAVADFVSAEIAVNRDRLYEPDYREVLRSMVVLLLTQRLRFLRTCWTQNRKRSWAARH